MKKYLGENIRFLRKQRGINQTFLGLHLHKGHTTIGNWEKELSEPSLLELMQLANFFEIPVGDLLEKDLSSASYFPSAKEQIITKAADALVETHTQQSYLVPEFAYAGADKLLRIEESAMSPIYNTGDIVACKHIKQLQFIQWGKIYALETEQGMLIRRLFESPHSTEYVSCHSGNATQYPPFDLAHHAILSAALVIGAIVMR